MEGEAGEPVPQAAALAIAAPRRLERRKREGRTRSSLLRVPRASVVPRAFRRVARRFRALAAASLERG
jgi:hypothetical protein